MNLLGKGTISAALFAATASVVIAAPAQSLDFTGVSSIEVTGFLAQHDGAGGIDFLGFGGPATPGVAFFGGVNGSAAAVAAWSTYANTQGSLTDILAATLTNDVFKFTFADASTLEFDLTSPVSITNASNPLLATLIGDVIYTSGLTGDTFATKGMLTGQTGASSFSISLQPEPVPTPVAVLPVIGGLLGMTSKRKREEENA